jgi:hypothetical protein
MSCECWKVGDLKDGVHGASRTRPNTTLSVAHRRCPQRPMPLSSSSFLPGSMLVFNLPHCAAQDRCATTNLGISAHSRRMQGLLLSVAQWEVRGKLTCQTSPSAVHARPSYPVAACAPSLLAALTSPGRPGPHQRSPRSPPCNTFRQRWTRDPRRSTGAPILALGSPGASSATTGGTLGTFESGLRRRGCAP